MRRETTCVTAILLLGGTASLALVILVLIGALVFELNPNDDGPLLWDQLAVRLVPLAILGIILLLLGSNYRRRNV